MIADQSPSNDVLERDIEWSGTIGLTMLISDVQVYQRTENIDLQIMDDGVLRIQAALKLFAMVSARLDEKHILNPAKVFTNDIDIISFIQLNSIISREDIISMDYVPIIKNYALRPDNIIINGILRLKIKYIVHLILDGVVLDFANNSSINGATVNVKDMESGEIRATATTGSNGRYLFNNLPPGIYLVEALTDSHKPEQKISVIKSRDTVDFVLHR